jgi:hypothetical protein
VSVKVTLKTGEKKMRIELNNTAKVDYVLVMDKFASINLTDGTRIELTADLMKEITRLAQESAEYFASI